MNTPLDLQRHYLLLQNLKRDVDEKLLTTEEPTEPFNFDTTPRRYTVADEARVHLATDDLMVGLKEFEKNTAAKYGLAELDEESVDRMFALRKQLDKSPDDQLSNEYKTLERRGVDEGTFEKYCAELQNAVEMPRSYQVGIAPELFRVLGGSPGYREGGWVDGHCYPASMRSDFMEHGLVVQVLRNSNLSKKVTLERVFGSHIAGNLEADFQKGVKHINDMVTKKIGSKMLVSIYGGLLLWTIWFKWAHIYEREIDRQKVRFAYRTLDEDAPLTRKQLSLLESHAAWSKSYYADSMEDEDEDEEEEDDEDKSE